MFFTIDKFITPPFNYTGSKFKLLKDLFKIFDYSKHNIVDLFMGGGSVLVNVIPFYDKVYGNDIIKELVEIHQSIINGDEIIEKLIKICPDKDDKEGFLELRNKFNKERKPEQLWALMLCCTSNMMRFNKKFEFNQTWGKRSINPQTIQKIEEYKSIRSEKVILSSKQFKEFPIMNNTFYYLDPPYSNTEAGYNCYWEKKDDQILYEYCKKIDNVGSTFCLSGVLTHNGIESDLLVKLSKDYKVIKINTDYNKVSRIGDKQTQEVVIVSY
jgi:DNA adenine methylase Dam